MSDADSRMRGSKPGWGRRVKEAAARHSILGVMLAYTLITLIITYPVAFRLRSALAGAPDQDALQHLWISWWTEKALLDLGTSPAEASYLYYPDGTYHPMLWVTPYPQVVALPLQLLWGPVAAHNLHLLLSFVLTGLTAYLLCCDLTRSRWASFLGGLIFAFFSNRLSHATAHLAQVETCFFPLYALYLLRLFHRYTSEASPQTDKPNLVILSERSERRISFKQGTGCFAFAQHDMSKIWPIKMPGFRCETLGCASPSTQHSKAGAGLQHSKDNSLPQISGEGRGRGEGKGQPLWHNTWMCGLLLALSMLVNIVHVAYFVLPFTVLFILYHLAGRLTGRTSCRPVLRSLVLALTLAAMLTAPFLLPFAWHSLRGQLSYLRMAGTVDYSADLLGLVTPALTHPVWGQWPPFRAWATALIGRGNVLENTVYLGGVTLFLAGLGIKRHWNEARFWLILALAGLVLSLGPTLKIGGLQTGLPLPYALLERLPFYQWGRIPGRANETIVLALAVLASLGAQSWRRFEQPSQGWLTAILSGLILFDYIVAWPFPTMDASVPGFYQHLAREPGDFAVLDLPQWPIWLRAASNRAMYYQTVHQHKMVGGYVWRLPEGVEGGMKALQEWVLPPVGEDIIPRPSPAEALQTLNRYRIRYVVLHKGVWSAEEDEAALASLRHLLGEPFYDDRRLAAFLVPETGVEGDENGLLALSYGWYEVEEADGHPARWLKDEGTLYVHRLTEGRYRLRFAVYPFRGPRHVQVTVNGQALATFEVAGWQELVTSPFTLAKGQNDIVFQVAEGCEVPAEVEASSKDRRCLSVLFQDVRLIPELEEARPM